jgi:hypothetical protein
MEKYEQSQEEKLIDAFGPVALATFALNPSGAHFFRAQHEQIIRSLDLIADILSHGLGRSSLDAALRIRTELTCIVEMIHVHQSAEEFIIRRALESEPRLRMTAEQFERQMIPLMAEFSNLGRSFVTPSAILAAPNEFAQEFTSLYSRIQERFKTEERELFSAYDRAMHVASPGGVMLAMPLLQ